jgi:glycosyltransferase involved in cell wall biosynthesis
MVNNFARITGGADLHCLELTEGLRQRGHEVRWLATASDRNLETEGDFVPYAVDAQSREKLSAAGRLRAARWAFWNPHAAAAADHLIRSFRPDVVHVHKTYVQLSVAPVIVAARHHVPVVQTAHDYEFVSASAVDSTGGSWDRDESRFSYQALNSATMLTRRFLHKPRVSRWIAVSRDLSRIYRETAGVNMEVIPNFTDPSPVPPVAFGEREGVVFVGRLSPEKGVEHVLEAARLNPGIPFTIVGDGPLAGRVKSLASDIGNLRFPGFVDNSEGRALLRGARVCAMPSLWREPGSLVGLEAMSEGTPVVTYSRGGLAEYVADAGAGVVLPERDGPPELAAAIASLHADGDGWERFSKAGREAVGTVHSRPAYLESLESVYRSVPGPEFRPASGG